MEEGSLPGGPTMWLENQNFSSHSLTSGMGEDMESHHQWFNQSCLYNEPSMKLERMIQRTLRLANIWRMVEWYTWRRHGSPIHFPYTLLYARSSGIISPMRQHRSGGKYSRNAHKLEHAQGHLLSPSGDHLRSYLRWACGFLVEI